jgi:hypothetical protein
MMPFMIDGRLDITLAVVGKRSRKDRKESKDA